MDFDWLRIEKLDVFRARLGAICMSLLCVFAIDAHAATITVTNTNHSGPGSLRQAVGSAQNGDTLVGPHPQKSAGPFAAAKTGDL